MAASLNTNPDVHILESLLPKEGNWLLDLEPQGLRLHKIQRGTCKAMRLHGPNLSAKALFKLVFELWLIWKCLLLSQAVVVPHGFSFFHSYAHDHIAEG